MKCLSALCSAHNLFEPYICTADYWPNLMSLSFDATVFVAFLWVLIILKKVFRPAIDKRESAMSDIEKHLVCSLTGKLLSDPVLADDECLYERSALEKHIQHQTTRALRSPVKKERMSKRFLPAPQIRKVIQDLVEANVITGLLAEEWKERNRQERSMEELKKDAANGELDALLAMGTYYGTGDGRREKGASKEGFYYFEQARKQGSIVAMAHVGAMYLTGVGVDQDQSRGIMYLSMAAEGGSNLAAFLLGSALADGSYDLPKDQEEAEKWLEQAVSGNLPHKHMPEANLNEAQEILEKLERKARN